jgi:hypothetical protein
MRALGCRSLPGKCFQDDRPLKCGSPAISLSSSDLTDLRDARPRRTVLGGSGDRHKPGAQCAYARRLRSPPAQRQPGSLAAAGTTVPGALAARGRSGRHHQRGMVGIGDRDLVACTRTRSPSGHPAAGRVSRGRHDCPGACRNRGHQHQAAAATPGPPASGRDPPVTAAGACRPGTPPLRPDTVTAEPRTCRI